MKQIIASVFFDILSYTVGNIIFYIYIFFVIDFIFARFMGVKVGVANVFFGSIDRYCGAHNFHAGLKILTEMY